MKAFEKNCCMKSDQIDGNSLFAPVLIIPYTLHPILPASSCICIWWWDCMVLSGYNFVREYQSAPHSASHLCTTVGVACWISGHSCHSTRDELQPSKLYSATRGGYLSLWCPHALPNSSPVTCCLVFLSSLPTKPRLHISSKTSPPIVAKCILHSLNFPKAAWSWKSAKNLKLLSPSAEVHLAAVSDDSVPGQWTDAWFHETQPPILSSACWTY